MLTLDKSHTINIGKYRLRVNSPPGEPVLLLDSRVNSSLRSGTRMTEKRKRGHEDDEKGRQLKRIINNEALICGKQVIKSGKGIVYALKLMKRNV